MTRIEEGHSWADVYRGTNVDDKQFLYESPFDWRDKPLERYDSLDQAEYPPVTFTCKGRYMDDYFPIYDMLIQPEKGPKVLFTGAHNRLLYECMRGEIGIERNTARVLVNQDDHDDIILGDQKYGQIHIGNWGSHGYVNDFWGTYVHLCNRYTPTNSNPLRPKIYVYQSVKHLDSCQQLAFHRAVILTF